MFFKINFSGTKKVEEKIIGLLDIPKIKKSDLVNQNLKFIFFNKTKIFEYLANYIFNKTPLLNFAETNNAQIVSGQFNIKTPSYSPLHKEFQFDNIIKNLSSGFLSFLFLLLIVSMFSNFDFLRIETPSNFNESNVVFEDMIEEKFSPNQSILMIKNLLFLENRFSEINSFLLTESEFIVNGDSVEFEQINSYPAFSKNNISFNELLIGLFEVEKNLKFKVFESEVDKKQIQNVVLKLNSFENSINALSIMSAYENLSLRKAFLAIK